jgi:WD40 repeat protein
VQTKKSTAANDTKSTQKPTDANSRSLENCRTSSRREESSTQKASPKLSKVNAQPFEAASKLPAPATDPNPAKDTAAATASTSTADCEIVSNHPILLPPHPTAVKCVDIHGPCAFTASEDGTVHIYDLDKNLLVKKISAHTDAVTWLYGISLKMSSEVLSNIKSTTEYLSHLTLVTGSEDKNIRQFALDSGALIHERFCNYTPTCESGTRTRRNLVGTKEGVILSYDTKAKSIMRIKKFQVKYIFKHKLTIPEAKTLFFAGEW